MAKNTKRKRYVTARSPSAQAMRPGGRGTPACCVGAGQFDENQATPHKFTNPSHNAARSVPISPEFSANHRFPQD